jgi:hypothetical protein
VNLLIRLLLILLIAVGFSCKKDDKNTSPIVIQGSLELQVQAKHHSLEVPDIMIYLMRNATSFPGNDSSIYTYRGKADVYGRYTFEKLFPGNYYVYASGYDSLWQSYVVGNCPVTLNDSTAVNNELSVIVNVSE